MGNKLAIARAAVCSMSIQRKPGSAVQTPQLAAGAANVHRRECRQAHCCSFLHGWRQVTPSTNGHDEPRGTT
ncbi:MAG: hypothetical protein BGO98_42585 [Myxococcales bacterium 68-20]|nr:MAG: hypothetical protein BGO98_42585 [Myxococcales bacterium 68-20]